MKICVCVHKNHSKYLDPCNLCRRSGWCSKFLAFLRSGLPWSFGEWIRRWNRFLPLPSPCLFQSLPKNSIIKECLKRINKSYSWMIKLKNSERKNNNIWTGEDSPSINLGSPTATIESDFSKAAMKAIISRFWRKFIFHIKLHLQTINEMWGPIHLSNVISIKCFRVWGNRRLNTQWPQGWQRETLETAYSKTKEQSVQMNTGPWQNIPLQQKRRLLPVIYAQKSFKTTDRSILVMIEKFEDSFGYMLKNKVVISEKSTQSIIMLPCFSYGIQYL